MKLFDRVLQKWRIYKANPFINLNDTVLDIGSLDGSIFESLTNKNISGVGIEPNLIEEIKTSTYTLLRGMFPRDFTQLPKFDVITLLAVLEHIPTEHQKEFAEGCAKHLKKGGKLIITVPSEVVDYIIPILVFFRIMDGTSLEEHYGYKASQTPKVFSQDKGFKLLVHKKFQLGVNNLYVFEKI